jgi:hexokinase
VINTEWTIRGTDAPLVSRALKTPWDITLDAHSDAPGFQPFEYMTSGRYLGELVRLIFTDVVASEGTTDIPSSLHRRNAMSTHFLAETVARSSDDAVVHRLETAFPSNQHALNFWSPQRTDLLRSIARAVQVRSAALVAAACVGLLACVGEIHVDITPSASEDAGDADGVQNGHVIPRANIHAPQELVIAYAGGTISHYPQWLETCQR